MRLVVVTWDGGSNRQPFELMCGALAGRGDTVDVLSHRSHRGLYEALGVAFHGLGVGEGPPGLRRSLSEEFARVTEIWRSPGVADETAAVLASVSPDVAVVDGLMLTAAATNTFVFGELPHRQILDRADVVVTHAGHGTVLSALTAGVPLVCLPLGRDQHDIARRVVAAGAGVTVDAVQDEAAIRDGVQAVMRDASYADQAATLAQAIAHYRGIQEALEILDSAATQ